MLKDLVRDVAQAGFARIAAPTIPSDDLYLQIDGDFIAAPPVTMHGHIPDLLAGVWAALRESTLAGPADREGRETVATEVSGINSCPYCVEVHGSLAGDARSEDVGRWARATRTPSDPVLADPPFEASEAPYFIGTGLAFHYINRMVSAFLTPTASGTIPTPETAAMIRDAIGVRNLEPGASLRFVKDAPLPPELVKLNAASEVAAAWGALCAAAERCGENTLTTRVRTSVGERIDKWDGTDPRLGWNAPDEGPGARFALTVALAAYRVDDELVATTRNSHPTDIELVSIAAWSSMRAVRRIATWL
ncbi:MAG: hypothetical protein WD646_00075 [Actinomycetota bacterium]